MSQKELNKEYLKKVGRRISELREGTGITQDEFARFLGVPRTTVAKYETGIQDFKSETIIKMCDYFKVSADYLLRGASSEALDVHRKTGLTDDALNALEETKNTYQMYFTDAAAWLCVINELLSDKEFLNLSDKFARSRCDWQKINNETILLKNKLQNIDKDEYIKITDRLNTLNDEDAFLRWKILQAIEKYAEKMLERKL